MICWKVPALIVPYFRMPQKPVCQSRDGSPTIVASGIGRMVAHGWAASFGLDIEAEECIPMKRNTNATQARGRLEESIVPPIAAIRLARVCAYSAQAPEWAQFVRAVSPVIALAARRVSAVWGDPSHATVSEIVQEVFLKLCEDDRRILRECEDRGNDSFLKLLRMITASVGTDHFRRTRAEKRGGRTQAVPLEPHISADDVSDSKATEAVEWPSLMDQLDGLLKLYPKTVSARDRYLFWLYYRQGLTAEAISSIPAIGLSAKGVESALQRLTRLLRETIANGKPQQPELPEKKLLSVTKAKGFSRVVAIDSVKRR
jgi:RNA polymerase sigma-70 factor, ECF subfamily